MHNGLLCLSVPVWEDNAANPEILPCGQRAFHDGRPEIRQSRLLCGWDNKVNPAKLTYTDSEETYQLQLPELQSKKMQQKLKGSELHIEFSKIKYTPFSMKEQIAYEQAHLKETVLNPGNVINHVSAGFGFLLPLSLYVLILVTKMSKMLAS